MVTDLEEARRKRSRGPQCPGCGTRMNVKPTGYCPTCEVWGRIGRSIDHMQAGLRDLGDGPDDAA